METRPWQQNIWKHVTAYQNELQFRIRNGTARVPSTERSRSSNPKLQIPFPQHTRRDGGVIFTPPMGQIAPTNRNHPKHTETIERNTDGFSIRTLIWTIQLQQNAVSLNGLRSRNPWKTNTRGTWSYHSVNRQRHPNITESTTAMSKQPRRKDSPTPSNSSTKIKPTLPSARMTK